MRAPWVSNDVMLNIAHDVMLNVNNGQNDRMTDIVTDRHVD